MVRLCAFVCVCGGGGQGVGELPGLLFDGRRTGGPGEANWAECRSLGLVSTRIVFKV